MYDVWIGQSPTRTSSNVALSIYYGRLLHHQGSCHQHCEASLCIAELYCSLYTCLFVRALYNFGDTKSCTLDHVVGYPNTSLQLHSTNSRHSFEALLYSAGDHCTCAAHVLHTMSRATMYFCTSVRSLVWIVCIKIQPRYVHPSRTPHVATIKRWFHVMATEPVLIHTGHVES